MNKIWKFNDSKSNKLILIKDKIIYKGNKIGSIIKNKITSNSKKIKA